jgi:hypothetical protein
MYKKRGLLNVSNELLKKLEGLSKLKGDINFYLLKFSFIGPQKALSIDIFF